MLSSKKKLICLLMLLFLSACQRKFIRIRSFPDKINELSPLKTSRDFVFDSTENSISLEKNKIKIRVKNADFEFLFNDFSYFVEKNEFGYISIYRLVPFYIAKRAKGVSDIEGFFSEYTVLYIYIENNSDNQILFNPKRCVMVDNLGNQYAAFDGEFFKNNNLLYGYMEDAPFSGIKMTISPLSKILGEVGDIANAAASITPYGVLKVKGSKDFRDEDKYDYKYPMDDKIFLGGGEIYPTVHYSGFLVFRKLHPKATSFKLIFPHIGYKYTSDGRIMESLNFEFDFSIIADKKPAYYDTTSKRIKYKK